MYAISAVDRRGGCFKCKRAGITPDQVLSTLSGYYGGQYVSNFNRFSKVYKVMIQADPKFRLDEASLNNAFCAHVQR